MPKRSAQAVWEGNLLNGTGKVSVESGLFKGPYSFNSRFKTGAGTNPEELIAAAHAGCFSMALSGILTDNGFKVESIETSANVFVEPVEDGFEITRIDLETKGEVLDITKDKFAELAMLAKVGCPVSKALKAVKTINLKAELL